MCYSFRLLPYSVCVNLGKLLECLCSLVYVRWGQEEVTFKAVIGINWNQVCKAHSRGMAQNRGSVNVSCYYQEFLFLFSPLLTLNKLFSVSLGFFFLKIWATKASKVFYWGDQSPPVPVCMERGVSRDARPSGSKSGRTWANQAGESLHLWKDPMSDSQFCEVFLRLGKPSKNSHSDALWNSPCFWKIFRSFPLPHLCRHGAKKECQGERGSPCIFSCLVFNSRLRNHGPNVRQAGRWTMERIQDKLKWLLPLAWPVYLAKWFSPQL